MKALDRKKTGIIYSIAEDGITLETTVGKKIPNPMISRAAHNSLITYAENDMMLNRAVRREHTLLYGGNLPVFAMGTTKRFTSTEPPILNMGDIRFSAHWEGKAYSFAEGDIIKVQHVPGGTKWEISFDALPRISFCLYASLMGEKGIAATLEAKGSPKQYEGMTFTVTLGNCRIAARNFLATWFNELSEKVTPEVSLLSRQVYADGSALQVFGLESDYEKFYERAFYGFWGAKLQNAQAENGGLQAEFALHSGVMFALSGVHAPFDQTVSQAALCKSAAETVQVIEETESYYKNLLELSQIHTPSQILDTGIHHAMLNHDYGHVETGWLEGCHWWNCYWTNNYQISAAIALGHYELAKKALLFFGLQPQGYNCTSADGKPLERKRKKDGSVAWGYDGVPYYLYELWQYTQQTGDLSVAEAVAEHMHKNCLALIAACDPDGDGLYSWHRGCNSFMYQTDHFSVPGQGASPSLMMAGDFERFAQILRLIGKNKLAKFYEQQAARTYKALKKNVWEETEGYFLTAVDCNGDRCRSHYYTDLVFPYLYTSLEDSYGLLPLLHLKDSLTFRSETTGGLLMRVGEQKPDLFGNNNPMPVQMAEAARALLKMGDISGGYDLMEACALANSIYTEAPGSSPERLNDFGKGEANFIFGNPAASVAYTAIDGLFGLRLADMGTTLELAPALPEDFQDWSIRLPYGYVSYKKDNAGGSWHVRLPEGSKVQKLRFRKFIPDKEGVMLSFDGKAGEFTTRPTLNGCILQAEYALNGRDAEIHLQCAMKAPRAKKPYIMVQGESCKYTPKDGETLLSGLPGKKTAPGTYYTLVLEKERDIYLAQPITVLPAAGILEAGLDCTGENAVLHIKGNVYRSRNSFEVQLILGSKAYTATPESDKLGYFTCDIPVEKPADIWPAFEVGYTVVSGKKTLVKGITDAKALWPEKAEYSGAEQADIKELLKDNQMNADNAWRGHGGYPIKTDGKNGSLQVAHTQYAFVPVEGEEKTARCAVVEYGRTNDTEWKVENLGRPAVISLPVGKSVGAVSLLYGGEVEVRLTEEMLGRFVLHYSDGSDKTVPIISGKNIGSLFSNYAAETEHVILYPYGEQNNGDSMNHYALACNPAKVLESLEIRLIKEDCQLALVGMNIYR